MAQHPKQISELDLLFAARNASIAIECKVNVDVTPNTRCKVYLELKVRKVGGYAF